MFSVSDNFPIGGSGEYESSRFSAPWTFLFLSFYAIIMQFLSSQGFCVVFPYSSVIKQARIRFQISNWDNATGDPCQKKDLFGLKALS